MYKKLGLVLSTVILFSGCVGMNRLGTAMLDGAKRGLSGKSTAKEKKMTKEEYVKKCEQKYGKENPNMCSKLVTLDTTSRCSMELRIKNNIPLSQALEMCKNRSYNTHFLDDYKKPKKETINSCMEEYKWRFNSDINLANFCYRKIKRRDSEYIE